MPKGKQRKKDQAKKLKRRTAQYLQGGGDSTYARKKKWLAKNGLWGFEVPHPKPW